MRLTTTISIAIMALSGAVLHPQEPLTSRRAVTFIAEEITLSVNNELAGVSGTYHFRNNTSHQGNYPVIFPFHVDSLSSFPHRISGFVIETDSTILEIRPHESRAAVTVNIPLRPNAVTIWRLDFTQRITGNHARYILTSTQAWSEPLKEATYCFVAPRSFEEVVVWPKQDSISRKGDRVEYWAHKKDFMPDRDMEITWGKK